MLYRFQKKFDKVIEQLREVEYEDLSYNLGAKSTLIYTYYETDEMEALYSLFDSFNVWLNRNKDIPEQNRNNYKNFIRFTKKLTKLIPGDNKSIKKFKEDLDSTPNIVNRSWLKKKISELEN